MSGCLLAVAGQPYIYTELLINGFKQICCCFRDNLDPAAAALLSILSCPIVPAVEWISIEIALAGSSLGSESDSVCHPVCLLVCPLVCQRAKIICAHFFMSLLVRSTYCPSNRDIQDNWISHNRLRVVRIQSHSSFSIYFSSRNQDILFSFARSQPIIAIHFTMAKGLSKFPAKPAAAAALS